MTSWRRSRMPLLRIDEKLDVTYGNPGDGYASTSRDSDRTVNKTVSFADCNNLRPSSNVDLYMYRT